MQDTTQLNDNGLEVAVDSGVRNRFRIAVRGLIRNAEGQFLVLKRSKTARGEKGYWELPGGGLDHGESPQAALIREIVEETALSARVHEPLLVWDYLRSDGTQIIGMTFMCTLTTVDSPVVLSSEHDVYQWLTADQILHLKIFPELAHELGELMDRRVIV